jgi:hypothetical protein
MIRDAEPAVARAYQLRQAPANSSPGGAACGRVIDSSVSARI